MEFFHPMFARNGMRNLKEIKRGNQSKKEEEDAEPRAAASFAGAPVVECEVAQPPTKKPRAADYSIFKTDVARLQKSLDEFEHDLKSHTIQVQQKLAYILMALDESDAAPSYTPTALVDPTRS